ncbi:MAG: peptidoglycan editing factor PgeF [Bryobacterales bacterium]|nr:peptidoglycan editing factor PgeF [Bryobacterales bacterium]MDE0622277.1 peptidoglycan editing factor PgeF [Bryobacterales bacterium]
MLWPDELGVLRVSGWTDWDWLIHGFSTRSTGDFLDWPSDDEICKRFGAAMTGTAMPKQVHSGRCVRADRAWSGARPEADAVCTNRPCILVGVRTADCLPILLVDPSRRAVAAVHAGWRGAVARVLPGAIESMASEYGCKPGDIEAAMGPGIGPCCFEVGEEVAGQFSEEFIDRDGPKPHVDLVGILGAQLRQAGVDRFATAGHCTSCDLDRYFSHRAEHGETGRMLALVGLHEG